MICLFKFNSSLHKYNLSFYASIGNFYIYTEASSPAQPGDMTIIETQEDLRGCFCLRLAYSFVVYGAGHSLVFEVGGNKIRSETSLANQYSQDFTAPKWRIANIPIDVREFVRVSHLFY